MTLHKMEVNFRIEELIEEHQLKIIRFVNQCASESDTYRERKFKLLEDVINY